jgi:hypothetical protein
MDQVKMLIVWSTTVSRVAREFSSGVYLTDFTNVKNL